MCGTGKQEKRKNMDDHRCAEHVKMNNFRCFCFLKDFEIRYRKRRSFQKKFDPVIYSFIYIYLSELFFRKEKK